MYPVGLQQARHPVVADELAKGWHGGSGERLLEPHQAQGCLQQFSTVDMDVIGVLPGGAGGAMSMGGIHNGAHILCTTQVSDGSWQLSCLAVALRA